MEELKVGGYVYPRYGEPVVATGETKQSWIVGPSWYPTKINKKALREGTEYGFFLTSQQAEDARYVDMHQPLIARAVGYNRDLTATQLREIARIIGYVAKGEKKDEM